MSNHETLTPFEAGYRRADEEGYHTDDKRLKELCGDSNQDYFDSDTEYRAHCVYFAEKLASDDLWIAANAGDETAQEVLGLIAREQVDYGRYGSDREAIPGYLDKPEIPSTPKPRFTTVFEFEAEMLGMEAKRMAVLSKHFRTTVSDPAIKEQRADDRKQANTRR